MCLLKVSERCGRQAELTNVIREEFGDVLRADHGDRAAWSAEDFAKRLANLEDRIREMARPPTTLYLVYCKEHKFREGEEKVRQVLEKYEIGELDLTLPALAPPPLRISKAFSAFARFPVQSCETEDSSVLIEVAYAPLVCGLTAAHPMEPTIFRFSTEGNAPLGLLQRIKEIDEVEYVTKVEWQAVSKSRAERLRQDSAVDNTA
ncbi:Hypothetical predicted protein [Lecanosticta acicola]|uniref:Uncharacterized protein n=1 Tax=Lecanosticta acicola TaxID=111012 RepID=A0AAI8Z490_9PEZI|nr:Hypothetical predicted protein [Lecanosticta acicola]